MGFKLTTLVVICTDCTGSFKFIYYMITTTMVSSGGCKIARFTIFFKCTSISEFTGSRYILLKFENLTLISYSTLLEIRRYQIPGWEARLHGTTPFIKACKMLNVSSILHGTTPFIKACKMLNVSSILHGTTPFKKACKMLNVSSIFQLYSSSQYCYWWNKPKHI